MFTVQDFVISANPSTLTMSTSTAGTSTISVNGLQGFSGTVNLFQSSSPGGLSVSLTPSSIVGSGTGTLTASAAIAGTYTVTVNGLSGTLIHSITITIYAIDRPPIAAFTFNPTTPVVGQSVNFDASASADPDGTIVNYAWDFGDTTTGSGVVATHVYVAAGTYTVTLTVTDNSLNLASTSTSTTVFSVTGAHASLVRWKADVDSKRLSLSKSSIQTLRAFGANDGNRTVWVFVRFHTLSATGTTADFYTQEVQLSPGQTINGKTDTRFSATFTVALGAYTVTSTIYYSASIVQPPLGDPSFKPDLPSQKTLTFTVVT